MAELSGCHHNPVQQAPRKPHRTQGELTKASRAQAVVVLWLRLPARRPTAIVDGAPRVRAALGARTEHVRADAAEPHIMQRAGRTPGPPVALRLRVCAQPAGTAVSGTRPGCEPGVRSCLVRPAHHQRCVLCCASHTQSGVCGDQCAPSVGPSQDTCHERAPTWQGPSGQTTSTPRDAGRQYSLRVPPHM